ncbi:MAG: ABC transporter substrate-binding protein [Burkholderiales bacterium]|nr:ABC transporter substrate-binding protein [Burkholderiales bacterium]
MITRLLCYAFLALTVPLAAAFSVGFVNPGKSTETYWVTVSQVMQAAAKQLDIQLEVVYAERDHLRMEGLTQDFANRPPDKRPEFLILTNERRMGGTQLKIAEQAGINVLFAFSGILDEDRIEYATPRTRYPHWLGTLEPHAEDAGYQTMEALIVEGLREHRQGADGKLHVVAIAGDRSTAVSIRRNAGMLKAIAAHTDVVLDQTVFGDWQRAKAAEQANVLYLRYPGTQLVWCGNDEMAFGAMDALKASGKQPGRDKLFSGINTSREAMNDLIAGQLTTLSGGHYMTGAWALVMLYDYKHGRDFSSEGLELDKPMFARFRAADARKYLERFTDGVPDVDFRRFSKALNPALKQYDFRFTQLLAP